MPGRGAAGEELAAAQEELSEAEQGGRVTARTPWQSVVEARPVLGGSRVGLGRVVRLGMSSAQDRAQARVWCRRCTWHGAGWRARVSARVCEVRARGSARRHPFLLGSVADPGLGSEWRQRASRAALASPCAPAWGS